MNNDGLLSRKLGKANCFLISDQLLGKSLLKSSLQPMGQSHVVAGTWTRPMGFY